MVMEELKLAEIQKISHNLDHVISNGLTDMFRNAEKLWCSQHMQEYKIGKLAFNRNSLDTVMADIYGTQNKVLFQSDLADADDFDAKI